MIIDGSGLHKGLKGDKRQAALLVQVISWIEESHYWVRQKGGGQRKDHIPVVCKWCGAKRDNYYSKLTDMEIEQLQLCEGNPVLKAYAGDPNIHYTLNRIKP